MQSFLQYRRLRKQAEDDVNRARQTRSSASTIAPTADSAEKEHDDSEHEAHGEKPTQPELGTEMLDLPGVTVSRPDEKDGKVTFHVGWGENDPHNPKAWTMKQKWLATATTCVLTMILTVPTSIDGPTQDAFVAYYGVNDLAGSMTTGIYLIGVGFGSLFAGPFSETLGRNPIYISTMVVVVLFLMGKALSPNYGAAIAFRGLAALFAAAPMTVMGGTVGDMWSAEQITFALPATIFSGYAGPVLGPVIGAYTPQIGFLWADWISMILVGAALVLIVLGHPETYSPILLQWRAKHLRELTGDSRYQAPSAQGSLPVRLTRAVSRVFTMPWTEPIILVWSFYLTLLYWVMFTFLNAYTFIFQIPYGLSTSITNIIFVAMIPGLFAAAAMIPVIWHLVKKGAAKAKARGEKAPPELALYWSTVSGGAILMPVSLFWMAWTCYGSISIWSPIVASGVFGYALTVIFVTSYMYVIWIYQKYAASALGFLTFTRYTISGALVPASLKMYETIGPHWSLTLVAIVATLMAPVPFALSRYGPRIVAMSKTLKDM